MSNQSLLLSLMLFSTISSSYAYTQASPSYEPTKKPKELLTYEPSKKLKEMVVVEGIVYCQSCSKAGTWSLEGAKPLLSSPDSSCNLLTNINSGIAGAVVGEGKKVIKGKNYDVMVRAAPPMAFRSAYCPPINHY